MSVERPDKRERLENVPERERWEGELVHRLESLREIYKMSRCESEDCLKRHSAILSCSVIFSLELGM